MNKFRVIVNNGSASKKYALFEGDEKIIFSHYENKLDGFALTETLKDSEEEVDVEEKVFEESFSHFMNQLLKKDLINSEDDIESVGIRIVAPGKYFQEHRVVDKGFLYKLDEVTEFSPLHIRPVKKEISAIKDRLSNINIFAISDSAFHKTIRPEAKIYSLPTEITEEFDIYRYGYHGISVSSIVAKMDKNSSLKEKMIVCHLGGGSSLTAVKGGKSLDTSMGFSPLEGVPMASRVGTIDPNALLSIIDHKDFTTAEMQDFLYHKCGMLGLSGVSNDTRNILEEANNGNERADLAINFYTYEIQKMIGAYTVALGGLDTLIFTGTIGIRSAEVRRRVCAGLGVIGCELDNSKNKLQIKGNGKISTENSKVEIISLQTDEVGEMARILAEIV